MSGAPEQIEDRPDLASREFGATVVAVSDDFFASAHRLLLPEPPVARPGTFTDQGQWMDGWESRRRRGPGDHDWALIRLGLPGTARSVVVDTAFFRGNHPESAGLDGTDLPGNPSPDELAAADWFPLVPDAPLQASSEHVLASVSDRRVTHVRLRMAPDGGIARLRVLGDPVPDPRVVDGVGIDLADPLLGAEVTACSDMRFGRRANLIAPGLPRTMGEGWETRRRREPGAEWAVVRLVGEGVVRQVSVDTRHFRGNAPAACDLETSPDGVSWSPLVSGVRLQPDQQHLIAVQSAAARWARLTIHPDGGVARLRLPGRLTAVGRTELALTWLNALPQGQLEQELMALCGSRAWARTVAAQAPFADADALRSAASSADGSLGEADWLKALAAHPRIGDRPPPGSQERREQSTAAGGASDVLSEIRRLNVAYEERFGFTYVVRASGRPADELLAILRERLSHERSTELAVAAAAQREITALRLDRLLLGEDA